jgi:hypothetical protein
MRSLRAAPRGEGAHTRSAVALFEIDKMSKQVAEIKPTTFPR